MWMRGGTSKGGFFLADDLPTDHEARDQILLRIMGSPDLRQIDGMGGGHPLTSKVAIVSPSQRSGVDVDYLFLQVFVDRNIVSDAQNCGNMLAGVGSFAIERGLVAARQVETPVSIYMENTGQIADATVQTPKGRVAYEGDFQISGVPGRHAPISLEFRDTAGSTCGALLPTGNVIDLVDGVPVTLIDNGMPCVLIHASDVGSTGYELRNELDSNATLKARIERIRLASGPLMNLGEVGAKPTPKIMLLAPPRAGGVISVRSFVPHSAHASIGVLGAVSVATACLLPGSKAADIAAVPTVPAGGKLTITIEHASGSMTCLLGLDDAGNVQSSAIVRTARKLMDGWVF